MRITTAPEKGKANRAIIDLLAEVLGLRKKDLELIRGQRHKNKCFLLQGAELSGIDERLRCLVDRDGQIQRKANR